MDGLLFPHDVQEDIRAVEARDEFRRVFHLEIFLDVSPDLRGRGRREREANRVRKEFADFGDLAVFGAKVVAPFRDAVRLVDRDAVDANRGEQFLDARGDEAFGRDIKKLYAARADAREVRVVFVASQRAVEEHGLDSRGLEL